MSYAVICSPDWGKVRAEVERLNARAAGYGLTVRYIVVTTVINGVAYYRITPGEQS
jgi:hypothetical protein